MIDRDCLDVLSAYSKDYHPRGARSLRAPGEGRAGLWRVETVSGPLLLRRWPENDPPEERLQFIQAVLWHATQEGYDHLPLPLETAQHAGYVRHDGHLWQLEPWAHGAADYHDKPSEERLAAAMIALAEFHQATQSFPIAHRREGVSPGVPHRTADLQRRLGRLPALAAMLRQKTTPIPEAAQRIVELAPHLVGNAMTLLTRAARLACTLQPCIGDPHEEHVFFDDDYVTALVSFGAICVDNIALDIAQLLGSLAGNDAKRWLAGLDAYQMVRPLTDNERYLIVAFDRGCSLVAGLQWVTRACHLIEPTDETQQIGRRLESLADRLQCFADRDEPSAVVRRSAG